MKKKRKIQLVAETCCEIFLDVDARELFVLDFQRLATCPFCGVKVGKIDGECPMYLNDVEQY
jgi:hypothetical protein